MESVKKFYIKFKKIETLFFLFSPFPYILLSASTLLFKIRENKTNQIKLGTFLSTTVQSFLKTANINPVKKFISESFQFCLPMSLVFETPGTHNMGSVILKLKCLTAFANIYDVIILPCF